MSLPLFGLIGYAFSDALWKRASSTPSCLLLPRPSCCLVLLYAQTGNAFRSWRLAEPRHDSMLHEPLLLAGLGMMIAGLGFKLSLVPFHLWTPDVTGAHRRRFLPSRRRRAKSLSSVGHAPVPVRTGR
ncbi:hypothetical protein KIF59_07700 [Enterobacter cloacae subsp. cloacae]|nr:hypothetical protein [Enterobacter cloacae subsp. cloacae]